MYTTIYFLQDPMNPFKGYIGKTDHPDRRKKSHFYNSSLIPKTKKNDWIKNLKSQNMLPIFKEVDVVLKSEWKFWEIYWISQFKTWEFELKNGTDGGDGITMTPETKEKMSIAKKGKKLSLLHRHNIGKSSKGRKFKHTLKTREKMSIAHKGKKLTEEHKFKLQGKISHNKGKTFIVTEETRQKLRDNANNNPNFWSRGKKFTVEHKKKLSDAKKGKTNEFFIKKFPIIGISVIDDSTLEFDSAYEASKILFGSQKYSGKILAACRGDVKTAKGFIWKIKQIV